MASCREYASSSLVFFVKAVPGVSEETSPSNSSVVGSVHSVVVDELFCHSFVFGNLHLNQVRYYNCYLAEMSAYDVEEGFFYDEDKM